MEGAPVVASRVTPSVRIVILQYLGWNCSIGAHCQVLNDMNERATSFGAGDFLKCTQ
jgi:hypothetical protein